MNTNSFEFIIIGAGAAGLMAGSRLKNSCILELSPTPASKVKISGGGKCNITNKNISCNDYLGNDKFISQILKNYTNKELIHNLKDYGLIPTIKKDSQYFCPKSSTELIGYLLHINKNSTIKYNTEVKDVNYMNNKYEVTTNKGKFVTKKLIVASGALSYPQVGVSDIAYKIADCFGHTINKTTPALVGLTVQKDEFWMKELSGISLPVKINVLDKKFEFDLLFTHKGISGPSILNTSLFWQKGHITIDFLPKKSTKQLFTSSNKSIGSTINLPKRFVTAFLEHIGLPNKPINTLSSEQKEKLSLLKNYKLSPAGTFGYKKAEVTKGGIDTKEIGFNMESKLQKNLYFIGECLDVTGRLGGFNIQWAFSSAHSIK
ncbi:MAG: NAD(FAD)-utilizing dehydrogenases [uncultured Campylobacterales bacterium]|uniref:NAD(FAD)-utilizing dehydrogenases n=1 Tax=uncultured Campylobacterales bacterium TaxID=352960 RepID=A0A6S6SLX9_9BACT|nr:MAG: NAD(FAD)-utilizing dehydrogenases [uncultured Campylobacterales bacterium]